METKMVNVREGIKRQIEQKCEKRYRGVDYEEKKYIKKWVLSVDKVVTKGLTISVLSRKEIERAIKGIYRPKEVKVKDYAKYIEEKHEWVLSKGKDEVKECLQKLVKDYIKGRYEEKVYKTKIEYKGKEERDVRVVLRDLGISLEKYYEYEYETGQKVTNNYWLERFLWYVGK